MKFPRRRFLHLAAGAAAMPAFSRVASAQTYPTRPITLIVPFPGGGPADAVGRLLAERLRVSLGQPIIIEEGPAFFGLGHHSNSTSKHAAIDAVRDFG
jgi:tripartite-type tricarboxylate transporter receptor subunit TctC